ncbi:MAG: universal stress protein [Deinococcus-Thermus bacterium]|nr:universal stress protein [Deinococcota bacterium]
MARKILIATDGSELGTEALDAAAELSAKLDRDLCIVHVLLRGRPTEELIRMDESAHMIEVLGRPSIFERAGGRSFLRSAEEDHAAARAVAALGEEVLSRAKARAVRAGARNVTTAMREGDRAEEILSVAEAEGAEMIVMGRRGLGRRGVALGSVSRKVLDHAPCKVLVVR